MVRPCFVHFEMRWNVAAAPYNRLREVLTRTQASNPFPPSRRYVLKLAPVIAHQTTHQAALARGDVSMSHQGRGRGEVLRVFMRVGCRRAGGVDRRRRRPCRRRSPLMTVSPARSHVSYFLCSCRFRSHDLGFPLDVVSGGGLPARRVEFDAIPFADELCLMGWTGTRAKIAAHRGSLVVLETGA